MLCKSPTSPASFCVVCGPLGESWALYSTAGVSNPECQAPACGTPELPDVPGVKIRKESGALSPYFHWSINGDPTVQRLYSPLLRFRKRRSRMVPQQVALLRPESHCVNRLPSMVGPQRTTCNATATFHAQ